MKSFLVIPRIVVQIGLVILTFQSRAQNETHTIPGSVGNRAFTTAAALQRQNAADSLQKAMLMKWIIQTYESRPLYSPVQMREQFQAVQSQYEQRTGFCLGCSPPRGNPYDFLWSLGGVIAGTAASREIGLGIGLLDLLNETDQIPTTQAEMYLRMSDAVQFQESDLIAVAEKLDRLRQQNNVAAIATEFILGIPRGQSAKTLYDSNLTMQSNAQIEALVARINANGQILISADELRALFDQEFANLRGLANESLGLIAQLTANQEELYRYMNNAELRATNQQLIAQQQAERQKRIDSANASVYILSTLVGFSDPERAHQMQVVGSSAIQIVDSLNRFATADALTSIALSGNMLGATMNIVGLFKRQSSKDQQVLRAIAELKSMLNTIRTEMHARFDRVDMALNRIYQTMTDRLNQIDLALGQIQGDVNEIQRSLLDVQADVHRVERKVFAFLDAGFRRDLNEQINLVVGYRETFGQPIPWLTYVAAENEFFTWAGANSKDELSSGSVGRGYDDASLFTELNSQPLENNLNYLDQYLATRFSAYGLPPFAEARLANPRDWALVANAYLELALESPMFFRQVATWRLDNIRSVGAELSRAIENITLVDATPSPIANYALFNVLIQNYRAKAAVFSQVLWQKEMDAWIACASCGAADERDVLLNYIVPDTLFLNYESQIAQTSDTNEIAALIERRDEDLGIFRRLTLSAYSILLSDFDTDGDLIAAGRELSGAKAILEAFIVLGFSQSVESDDITRSLLYGSERVLDLASAKELYQRSVNNELNSWPHNGRINIALQQRMNVLYPPTSPIISRLEVVEQRINALGNWITNRLNQIAATGRSEPLRLVNSTMDRIDAFRAAKLAAIPAPYLQPSDLFAGPSPANLFTPRGEPNVRYPVQYSENLRDWFDLGREAETGKAFSDSITNVRRYYRTRPVAP
jgi:hypothetical protein